MKRKTARGVLILALAGYLLWGSVVYENQRIQQRVQELDVAVASKKEQLTSLDCILTDTKRALSEEKTKTENLVAQNAELEQQISQMKGNPDFSYRGEFTVTYYCGEDYPHICGTANGVTSSGATAFAGVTVAADPSIIPTGTYIYIKGVGMRVVQDTGGGIQGNKLDVYVDTHDEALENGIHEASVWIITKGEN